MTCVVHANLLLAKHPTLMLNRQPKIWTEGLPTPPWPQVNRALAKVESLLKVDLNGDGHVGRSVTPLMAGVNPEASQCGK